MLPAHAGLMALLCLVLVPGVSDLENRVQLTS